MTNLIVRQPIKDLQQNVIGYEILFDNECGDLYNNGDDKAAADAIANFLMQGSDKYFDNKTAFLTFTPNLLSRNIPRIFQRDKLVIQINDNMIIHPFAQNIIHRYKDQGYRIAVNDFQFAPRYFSMMDIIDYIRLDLESSSASSFKGVINIAKGFHKKCIAYNVNTQESFDLAKELEVDYVQGSFIAENISKKAPHMEYLQSNFFQLVVEVTKDDPDLATVESIISRDVSLTYSLLKLVNSAYFALRNRATSIMQALVILGLGQLKQWVYLLSFKQEDDSLPEDLIKMSLLRANFCSELLPYASNMPISKSEAYLMGMFSTLEYIMEVPMENMLDELSISEDIKKALLSQEGRCGQLYQLVLNYEKADWNSITELAAQLDIPQNNISQVYFECVENVNYTWNNLMNISTDSPEEASTEAPEEVSNQVSDASPVNETELEAPLLPEESMEEQMLQNVKETASKKKEKKKASKKEAAKKE